MNLQETYNEECRQKQTGVIVPLLRRPRRHIEMFNKLTVSNLKEISGKTDTSIVIVQHNNKMNIINKTNFLTKMILEQHLEKIINNCDKTTRKVLTTRIMKKLVFNKRLNLVGRSNIYRYGRKIFNDINFNCAYVFTPDTYLLVSLMNYLILVCSKSNLYSFLMRKFNHFGIV